MAYRPVNDQVSVVVFVVVEYIDYNYTHLIARPNNELL